MKLAFGTLTLATLVTAFAPAATAEEWPLWRGPSQNGTSTDTGLVSTWSPAGENLAWKVAFIGRSTPIVVHGRVCVVGRTGEGIEKQEVVACYDADSGKRLWERRFNVYHSTVAFNRVGWPSLAGDSETGNVYAHTTAGHLVAFDPQGNVLWDHSLTEELGRASGYGGRSQTPIVWGDQLLLTFVNMGWGAQAPPRHRFFSFDKRTGEVLWTSTPGVMVYDMNTQSNPVVTEIGGRQLLLSGNADGHVYAVDLMTGHTVFGFPVSRQGLHATVVGVGDVVFATHSEENLDEATQGRFVAFKATGSGDLSGQELWRIDLMTDGFPTPAYRNGKLYIVDNSANLFRVDAGSGKIEWEYELGTVGKASPVVADGKIYVPELNGRFHILKDGADGPTSLDLDELKSEGDRYAEIYGSPAIAGGRVFLSTEGTLYAIGDRSRPYKATPGAKAVVPAGQGAPAFLQVVPAEIELQPGQSASFRARLFDRNGLPLGATGAEWSVEGLAGTISPAGALALEATNRGQGGAVVAKAGELTAKARVRVVRGLPWSEDFEARSAGPAPPHWVQAGRNFVVEERDGGKVLVQPVREAGLQRSQTFFGGAFENYTIEMDVLGSREKRRVPDIGLINGGYTMDLMGYHQRIEVRSWAADKRMARDADFAWEMGVWYRMKLRVDVTPGRALVRGKVWKRDESEPEAWTITVEDPLPIRGGSPGLVGYAPAEIVYDNIKVTPNG